MQPASVVGVPHAEQLTLPRLVGDAGYLTLAAVALNEADRVDVTFVEPAEREAARPNPPQRRVQLRPRQRRRQQSDAMKLGDLALRERAVEIYETARPGYHPIAQATMDAILAKP